MADAIIGALRVVLGLDTAAFTAGAKEATSSLDGLQSTFKKAIAGLGLFAIGKQFTDSITGVINSADELGKASQKFGVPVDQLSALKYAADLADVSFESLGKGLGKLSKAILDGAINPAGEAGKNFKALGISTRDAEGQIKDTGDVFLDVAAKFASMEDGATKTALAIRLFGKSGADLIPLLNEGRTGIEHLTAEAQRLGIVISEDTAKRAEIFNDNLKRIHATSQAVYLQIAEGMLPKLDELSQRFVDSAKAGEGFRTVGEFIGNTLEKIYQAGATVSGVFKLLWEELTALNEVASTWPFTEARAKAVENMKKVWGEAATTLEGLKNGLLTLPVSLDAFGSVIGGLPTTAKKGFGAINEEALKTKDSIDSFIQSQQKQIASTLAEASTVGAAVGVHEAMRVTMEANAIAKANDITLTDKQRAAIKSLSDQTLAATQQLAAAKLTQDFLSPWDQYKQKLRDINDLLGVQFPISADTAARASAQAAAKMTEFYGNAAATAAGNFATFFNTFAKGNSTMFAIAKAFSISQAIINTYVGATKALAELGPVLGPIAAAGIIAAGLAQVAKIVAEKPAKMALGGSFIVGGAGGTDTQLVPIMATPGERVSFDQNKYGDGAGGAKTVTVEGLKAKDYYRGDVLRDFVDNLNQAIGDGLKIKLA